jgi:hypothetical protein
MRHAPPRNDRLQSEFISLHDNWLRLFLTYLVKYNHESPKLCRQVVDFIAPPLNIGL